MISTIYIYHIQELLTSSTIKFKHTQIVPTKYNKSNQHTIRSGHPTNRPNREHSSTYSLPNISRTVQSTYMYSYLHTNAPPSPSQSTLGKYSANPPTLQHPTNPIPLNLMQPSTSLKSLPIPPVLPLPNPITVLPSIIPHQTGYRVD